ncbi:hypothetical protein, partial [Herbaspirillum chlorophenolicum]|uniref:hypothetical protein n=2 Tax=Herbaspirillum chlorophenolicum TaxID=211589 RepID=UPI00159CA8FA
FFTAGLAAALATGFLAATAFFGAAAALAAAGFFAAGFLAAGFFAAVAILFLLLHVMEKIKLDIRNPPATSRCTQADYSSAQACLCLR